MRRVFFSAHGESQRGAQKFLGTSFATSLRRSNVLSCFEASEAMQKQSSLPFPKRPKRGEKFIFLLTYLKKVSRQPEKRIAPSGHPFTYLR
ncbi:hypothetical protein, partial [Lujinxingia vulgaris]|uniref:hypothetical protein n=1 Tax=Lujinxingia vulgaris TaxID=2600176 RepID=UPI001E2B6188